MQSKQVDSTMQMMESSMGGMAPEKSDHMWASGTCQRSLIWRVRRAGMYEARSFGAHTA